jgi:predicted aspartyl protease
MKEPEMKVFFKATHEDDDQIEASFDGEVIIVKVDTGEDLEYVVLDKDDWEAIIWNYQALQEENKRKGGK